MRFHRNDRRLVRQMASSRSRRTFWLWPLRHWSFVSRKGREWMTWSSDLHILKTIYTNGYGPNILTHLINHFTQPWASSFLWKGVSPMKFGRWQWTFLRRFQRTSLFGGLEMTVARDPFPTRVGAKYQGFFGWLRVISEIWRIKTCFVLVLAPHQQRFFYPHSCSVFFCWGLTCDAVWVRNQSVPGQTSRQRYFLAGT